MANDVPFFLGNVATTWGYFKIRQYKFLTRKIQLLQQHHFDTLLTVHSHGKKRQDSIKCQKCQKLLGEMWRLLVSLAALSYFSDFKTFFIFFYIKLFFDLPFS